MALERDDALSDLGYSQGFRAGWNAAMKYHSETWTDASEYMKARVEQEHKDALATLASMEHRRSEAIKVLRA